MRRLFTGKFLNQISMLMRSRLFAPVFLAFISILAYGLFIPWLGFYGDDWSYIWLLYKAGDISPFFERNREIMSAFINSIGGLLIPTPCVWHMVALLARWGLSWSCYSLFMDIWPNNQARAYTAALILLVYPGFLLQSNAVTFLIAYIVFTLLIVSWRLTIAGIRSSGWSRWLYHATALVLSVFNLLSLEYFYLLELIRFPLIMLVSSGFKKKPGMVILRHSIAYAAVFISISIWRVFNQSAITKQYEFSLFRNLQSAPGEALQHLLKQVTSDIWQASVGVWWNALVQPQRAILSDSLLTLYWVIVIVSALLIFVVLSSRQEENQTPGKQFPAFLIAGLIFLFLGGGAIWVAGLDPAKDLSTTRFYLPFIAGSILIFISIIGILPGNKKTGLVITSLVIAFAIGTQFCYGQVFRKDWQLQESFYQQLITRYPGLLPGTTILADNIPTQNGGENSVSAAINYIYTENAAAGTVDYYLYFIPDRVQEISGLFTDTSLSIPHMIGTFSGLADRVIGLHLDSQNCIRSLNPRLDGYKSDIVPEFRQFARQLNPATGALQRATQVTNLPAEVFGSPPEDSWCTLYQRVELSASTGDWQSAANIADRVLAYAPSIPDTGKNYLIIEAYARTGQWKKANDLVKQVARVNKANLNSLCVFLDYIKAENISGIDAWFTGLAGTVSCR